MARHKRQAVEPLPTIWNCPDELWDNIVVPTLHELDPEPHTGRPRIDQRKALDGIIFQMRSGCQWDQLPARFGAKSTVHDWFQRWNKNNVMEKIMAMLIEECEDLSGVYWDWQSADGAMAKARFGGIMSVRTPRIAGKTAQNAVCSSMSTATFRAPCSSPGPSSRATRRP